MFAFVKKEKKRVNFKRLSVNTIGCLSNAKSENGSKQRDRQDLFPCETTCRELSFRRKYSSKGVYKITGEPVRPLSTGFPRFSNVTGEDIAPRSRSIDSTLPRFRGGGRAEERRRPISSVASVWKAALLPSHPCGNSFVLIAGFAWAIDSICARTKSYASSTTRRGSRSPICQYKHRPRWRTSKGNCPQRRHRLARTCIRVTIRCNLIRDLASRWVNIITCPT